jgi:hypothetical protein
VLQTVGVANRRAALASRPLAHLNLMIPGGTPLFDLSEDLAIAKRFGRSSAETICSNRFQVERRVEMAMRRSVSRRGAYEILRGLMRFRMVAQCEI